MSDEITDPTPGVEDSKEESTLTPEAAMAEVQRLRKENAAARVKSREVKAQLEEFNAWKQSQMTELEKAQAAAAAKEAELVEAWKEAAVAKYRVPEHLQRLVAGKSREEVLEIAKLLGEAEKADDSKAEETNNGIPALFGGVRGTPVASSNSSTKTVDYDAILRAQLRK